jgi:hypothetical protein
LLEANKLFLIFIILLGNVEVTELVSALGSSRGNDTDVVTEVVLLEVLLGKVLNVSLGEGNIGGNSNGQDVVGLGDLDKFSELSSLSLNLDTVNQILLVGDNVKDLILCGSRDVDGELLGSFLCNFLELESYS